MVTYIATLLGLAQINRVTFSNSLPLEFVLVIKVFKGKVNITAFRNEIASYLQDFYCFLVTLDDSDMDKWL
jgi:hypothetical protein